MARKRLEFPDQTAEDDLPLRSGVVLRRDGSRRRRTTIYLTPELAHQLKVYCAVNDVEMSTVVGEALEQFLDGK